VDLGRPAWQRAALCRGTGPDVWFPPRGKARRRLDVLRTVCRACPVIVECAEMAMAEADREIFGIWAGLSALDRKRLRRDGEVVTAAGDGWLYDAATGDVVTVPGVEPLPVPDAAVLVASVAEVSDVDAAASQPGLAAS
jgi:transcription factor WhiB